MSKIQELNSTSIELPQWLLGELAGQPIHVNRRKGAQLVTQYLFPVSARTLEAWPLPTRHVNGKAIMATVTLFEQAYAKMRAAPLIVGGRRSAQADQCA